MAALEIEVTEAEGRLVVVLAGEVDMNTEAEFGRVLADLLQQGQREIAIDVAKLAFMDSSGLAVIVAAIRLGAQLTILHASSFFADLLTVTGLDALVVVEGAEPSTPAS
jgi:anti-sigma B factor antagonist